MDLPSYWMDIGQPHDYLSGQRMHLDTIDKALLAKGDNITGSVLIHETAVVDPSARLGPHVTVGAGCKVGPGTMIKDSTLLAGSSVGQSSYMDGSILGWKSSIGSWCRVVNLSVIGEDVQVKNESMLNGTKILPHKGVNGTHLEAGKIIM